MEPSGGIDIIEYLDMAVSCLVRGFGRSGLCDWLAGGAGCGGGIVVGSVAPLSFMDGVGVEVMVVCEEKAESNREVGCSRFEENVLAIKTATVGTLLLTRVL